jgi:hypothetical protein
LFRICANLSKLSKSVADFIKTGIILNQQIISGVQISLLKTGDSDYFHICQVQMDYGTDFKELVVK